MLPTTQRTHAMKLKNTFINGLGILCLTCFASAQEGERKGRPPEGGGDGANRLAEFIKRADTDGDGKISKEEFSNMGRKESGDRFSKMDANSDGFVDQTEIASLAQNMRRGAEGQGMRRPEGGSPGREGGRPEGGPRPDGDRSKGAPEGGPRAGGMLGDPKEGFKRMDADGNGSVSEDEFIKATEKMREMMRNRGGQPGAPGQDGARRPGGEGGAPRGDGGFRRPPTEGDKPAPAPDKPKDAA